MSAPEKCNIIYDFFHPSVESIIEKFAIVEDLSITEEEAAEFLNILYEWKTQN